MRYVRGVGAAAAVVAVAVLISGCSGGAGDGVSPAPPVVGEAPLDEATLPTELPFPTEDAYATEKPTAPVIEGPPVGPAAKLDALAAQKGWEYDDDTYDSPSDMVTTVCEELPRAEKDDQSPAQRLAEGAYFWDDGKQILLAGIPELCPKWTAAVRAAASGKYDRWFRDGTYAVSPKPAEGEQSMPPGTYRSEGNKESCYWKRTSEAGRIIESKYATDARKSTVTIRPSDGHFTSEGCHVWKPVK
ncbi:hypothetical protein ACFVZH_28235 [Streptomyces sp. NPDC059534]|uniref:hypothetical protein n=1 Tax=Streptomyces sp. NPDC059534 TaxID=3346859 RepID=UPI0036ABFBBA